MTDVMFVFSLQRPTNLGLFRFNLARDKQLRLGSHVFINKFQQRVTVYFLLML